MCGPNSNNRGFNFSQWFNDNFSPVDYVVVTLLKLFFFFYDYMLFQNHFTTNHIFQPIFRQFIILDNTL